MRYLDLNECWFSLMAMTDAATRGAGFTGRMQRTLIGLHPGKSQRNHPEIVVGIGPDHGFDATMILTAACHPNFSPFIGVDLRW